MKATHDRTGEATLALCAGCKTEWACILTDDKELICAICWLRKQQQTRPVKEPRSTER